MPKLGMGPVRRRQLVDATIASIHEFGLADATVTRIAKKAGVSPGIVHHYFISKDELLFETMRLMLENLRRIAVEKLSNANTPLERINAIIDASFAPEQFSPQVTTAWLALYASARQSQSLTRILALYHNRLRSNLLFNLKQMNTQPHTHPHMQAKIEEQAETIAAIIDGLYLRASLNPTLHLKTTSNQLALTAIDTILSTQTSPKEPDK